MSLLEEELRVGEDVAGASLAELTTARLGEIARERGVDAATVVLYRAVREKHGEFIGRVDACEGARGKGKVVIVPAAFYREQPAFGGDGRVVRAAAEGLGMEVRRMEVGSVGRVTRNAEIVARELEKENDGAVILVSLSKGGADVRVAMERWPELRRKVRVWVNVCGLLRGTPISGALLGTRWWQRGLARGYLAYTRADADFVRELASGEGTLLGGEVRLPEGLRVVHVIGFPLERHLKGNGRARFLRMAHLGPNDGSMLLRDAMVEGGDVYPVWGKDHFMRGDGVAALMRRLLIYGEGLG